MLSNASYLSQSSTKLPSNAPMALVRFFASYHEFQSNVNLSLNNLEYEAYHIQISSHQQRLVNDLFFKLS
ncbi:MAG: hypothetical protein FJX71_00350 [Alphaproteobacteria bacterium]|nr:hypothetical protein [Alphaproteobacteria bacterium]